MFWQIYYSTDFSDVNVLDLGCGYGDLLLMSALNGAKSITGVDRDPDMVRITEKKLARSVASGIEIYMHVLDVRSRSALALLGYYDIAFCTSVLPYLKNRDMILGFMATRVKVSFIEMQYHGDGPGPEDIKNDMQMSTYLQRFWPSTKMIGKSFTGRTPPYRSIWRCMVEDEDELWQCER